MIRFEIDHENPADTGKITLVQGDSGVLTVELDGYELQDGDRLILNVREYPNDSSPLLFSSINATTDIRINCEDTREAAAGKYSAQLFLHKNGEHCPVEIWPSMSGTPSSEKSLKNFILYAKVGGVNG